MIYDVITIRDHLSGCCFMEFRQLRYFLAIAHHGTFRGASEALFIAQPALSTQIKKLEEELNCTLFVRSQRGAKLTDAGARFAQYASEINDQMEATKTAMSAMAGDTRRIRVGIPPLVSKTLSLALLSRARHEFPNLQLEIQELMTGVLRDRLASGAIEIALLNSRMPNEASQSKCLRTERLLIGGVGEIGQLLKSKKPFTVSDLAEVPLVMSTRRNCHREIVEHLAKTYGFKLSIAAEVDSPTRMTELVSHGTCAMIAPRSNFDRPTRKGYVLVPVNGAEAAWETNLVIASGQRKNRTVRAVADLIERIVLSQA
ncbi:LysR family transcriptional regulator [Ottowia thiooxydans]|uniref:DNA-binding transcriptional LysR family regulator n=1 Tax=Ottowia thiooxydans TaxID=219182 RepID=A0ABV2Q4G8_9BURK